MSNTNENWLARLRVGLSRSSSRLAGGISTIFSGQKLDDRLLEQLEEVLITADLGVETASQLTAKLARTGFDIEVSAADVRATLADEVSKILQPVSSQPGCFLVLPIVYSSPRQRGA